MEHKDMAVAPSPHPVHDSTGSGDGASGIELIGRDGRFRTWLVKLPCHRGRYHENEYRYRTWRTPKGNIRVQGPRGPGYSVKPPGRPGRRCFCLEAVAFESCVHVRVADAHLALEGGDG